MRLFDLHCDTPSVIFEKKVPDTPLDFIQTNRCFQVMAIWSDIKKSGEKCREDFFKIRDCLIQNANRLPMCELAHQLDTATSGFILAVEGAELLCGDISLIPVLFSYGVRIFCPMWRGKSMFGGAHDTSEGLTQKGKELLCRCEKLGIITDTSHMSERSFWDTAEYLTRPFIASHSNCKSICPHTRNLSDGQIREITDRGGLIGINLYPPFVSEDFEYCDDTEKMLSFLLPHVFHILELGGEKTLCMGGDRDGFESLPEYSHVRHTEKLYSMLLKHGIKEDTVNDIFFGNAFRFFRENLP